MKKYFVLACVLIVAGLLSGCNNSYNKVGTVVKKTTGLELMSGKNEKIENNTLQKNIGSKNNILTAGSLKADYKDHENTSNTTNINLSSVKDDEAIKDKSSQDINDKKFIQEVEQISTISQKPGFEKLDCNSFTTTGAIVLCEKKKLGFAKLFCYTSKINQPIKDILNIKLFPHLDKHLIEAAISYCKKQRQIIEQQEQQQRLLEEKIKKFNVSDCGKYVNKRYPNLKDQDAIDKLVKQCKIGYAINYAKTCDILTGQLENECVIAKKYIEQYMLMKKYSHDYGDFRLDF